MFSRFFRDFPSQIAASFAANQVSVVVTLTLPVLGGLLAGRRVAVALLVLALLGSGAVELRRRLLRRRKAAHEALADQIASLVKRGNRLRAAAVLLESARENRAFTKYPGAFVRVLGYRAWLADAQALIRLHSTPRLYGRFCRPPQDSKKSSRLYANINFLHFLHVTYFRRYVGSSVEITGDRPLPDALPIEGTEYDRDTG